MALQIDEPTILAAIEKVKTRLANKFKFGYYEKEDLEQEISIMCLQVVEKYDGRKPLENFFWVHCKNRLCNLKRDKYERLDKPCIGCPFFDPNKKVANSECTKYENKTCCELYDYWIRRNDRKKNLVNKSAEGDVSYNNHTYETEFDEEDKTKVLDIIDRLIPIELREDYIKYKYGVRLNALKVRNIQAEILKICKENNIGEYNA